MDLGKGVQWFIAEEWVILHFYFFYFMSHFSENLLRHPEIIKFYVSNVYHANMSLGICFI